MIKQTSYKKFSLSAHLGNLVLCRPNSCQLELTYGCGLRCVHCYTANYNRPADIAKELPTKRVKEIIDELKDVGVLWLVFTGGDPLTRPDFCELYAYARQKGFLITVFTNGYSLTKKHVNLFKRQPPFAVEITLNAVTEGLYEKISGVKGSFKKVITGIDALRGGKLPLKIKTMVTSLNLRHIAEIKKYLRGRGLKFTPDFFLHAGFNDSRPLEFRLPPEYFRRCREIKNTICVTAPQNIKSNKNSFFPCVAPAADGFQISPYGHISACCLIYKDDLNVLNGGVALALKKMREYFRGLNFTRGAKCKSCNKRDVCGWCPGKAWVETGSLEKSIDYCCKIVNVHDN